MKALLTLCMLSFSIASYAHFVAEIIVKPKEIYSRMRTICEYNSVKHAINSDDLGKISIFEKLSSSEIWKRTDFLWTRDRNTQVTYIILEKRTLKFSKESKCPSLQYELHM